MSEFPACPACKGSLAYQDGAQMVCPECGHEWSASSASASVAVVAAATRVIRDGFGNVLTNGDTVLVIKDLKLKGGGGTLKMGTKVKGIRLVEGDHNIDCKIEGFGAMALKSEFVRKVS